MNDDATSDTTTLSLHDALPILNDNAPQITSSATFNVAENTTAVGTVTATDADLPAQTVTFSVTGRADVALDRKSTRRNSRHSTTPDDDFRTKKNANNVYNVTVR